MSEQRHHRQHHNDPADDQCRLLPLLFRGVVSGAHERHFFRQIQMRHRFLDRFGHKGAQESRKAR